jgi:hypothetical protein
MWAGDSVNHETLDSPVAHSLLARSWASNFIIPNPNLATLSKAKFRLSLNQYTKALSYSPLLGIGPAPGAIDRGVLSPEVDRLGVVSNGPAVLSLMELGGAPVVVGI